MTQIDLHRYHQTIRQFNDDKEPARAVGACLNILKQYPRHLETYRLLAETFLSAEVYIDAADLFSRILSADPNDLFSHLALAEINGNQFKKEEALWHIERAAELLPHDKDIFEERKNLARQNDRPLPSEDDLPPVAALNIQIRSGLYPQAMGLVGDLLSAYPSRIDLKILQAELFWLTGLFDDAQDAAEMILKELPYSVSAHAILGDVLRRKNQDLDAAGHFSELQSFLLIDQSHLGQALADSPSIPVQVLAAVQDRFVPVSFSVETLSAEEEATLTKTGTWSLPSGVVQSDELPDVEDEGAFDFVLDSVVTEGLDLTAGEPEDSVSSALTEMTFETPSDPESASIEFDGEPDRDIDLFAAFDNADLVDHNFAFDSTEESVSDAMPTGMSGLLADFAFDHEEDSGTQDDASSDAMSDFAFDLSLSDDSDAASEELPNWLQDNEEPELLDRLEPESPESPSDWLAFDEENDDPLGDTQKPDWLKATEQDLQPEETESVADALFDDWSDELLGGVPETPAGEILPDAGLNLTDMLSDSLNFETNEPDPEPEEPVPDLSDVLFDIDLPSPTAAEADELIGLAELEVPSDDPILSVTDWLSEESVPADIAESSFEDEAERKEEIEPAELTLTPEADEADERFADFSAASETPSEQSLTDWLIDLQEEPQEPLNAAEASRAEAELNDILAETSAQAVPSLDEPASDQEGSLTGWLRDIMDAPEELADALSDAEAAESASDSSDLPDFEPINIPNRFEEPMSETETSLTGWLRDSSTDSLDQTDLFDEPINLDPLNTENDGIEVEGLEESAEDSIAAFESSLAALSEPDDAFDPLDEISSVEPTDEPAPPEPTGFTGWLTDLAMGADEQDPESTDKPIGPVTNWLRNLPDEEDPLARLEEATRLPEPLFPDTAMLNQMDTTAGDDAEDENTDLAAPAADDDGLPSWLVELSQDDELVVDGPLTPEDPADMSWLSDLTPADEPALEPDLDELNPLGRAPDLEGDAEWLSDISMLTESESADDPVSDPLAPPSVIEDNDGFLDNDLSFLADSASDSQPPAMQEDEGDLNLFSFDTLSDPQNQSPDSADAFDDLFSEEVEAEAEEEVGGLTAWLDANIGSLDSIEPSAEETPAATGEEDLNSEAFAFDFLGEGDRLFEEDEAESTPVTPDPTDFNFFESFDAPDSSRLPDLPDWLADSSLIEEEKDVVDVGESEENLNFGLETETESEAANPADPFSSTDAPLDSLGSVEDEPAESDISFESGIDLSWLGESDPDLSLEPDPIEPEEASELVADSELDWLSEDVTFEAALSDEAETAPALETEMENQVDLSWLESVEDEAPDLEPDAALSLEETGTADAPLDIPEELLSGDIYESMSTDSGLPKWLVDATQTEDLSDIADKTDAFESWLVEPKADADDSLVAADDQETVQMAEWVLPEEAEEEPVEFSLDVIMDAVEGNSEQPEIGLDLQEPVSDEGENEADSIFDSQIDLTFFEDEEPAEELPDLPPDEDLDFSTVFAELEADKADETIAASLDDIDQLIDLPPLEATQPSYVNQDILSMSTTTDPVPVGNDALEADLAMLEALALRDIQAGKEVASPASNGIDPLEMIEAEAEEADSGLSWIDEIEELGVPGVPEEPSDSSSYPDFPTVDWNAPANPDQDPFVGGAIDSDFGPVDLVDSASPDEAQAPTAESEDDLFAFTTSDSLFDSDDSISLDALPDPLDELFNQASDSGVVLDEAQEINPADLGGSDSEPVEELPDDPDLFLSWLESGTDPAQSSESTESVDQLPDLPTVMTGDMDSDFFSDVGLSESNEGVMSAAEALDKGITFSDIAPIPVDKQSRPLEEVTPPTPEPVVEPEEPAPASTKETTSKSSSSSSSSDDDDFSVSADELAHAAAHGQEVDGFDFGDFDDPDSLLAWLDLDSSAPETPDPVSPGESLPPVLEEDLLALEEDPINLAPSTPAPEVEAPTPAPEKPSKPSSSSGDDDFSVSADELAHAAAHGQEIDGFDFLDVDDPDTLMQWLNLDSEPAQPIAKPEPAIEEVPEPVIEDEPELDLSLNEVETAPPPVTETKPSQSKRSADDDFSVSADELAAAASGGQEIAGFEFGDVDDPESLLAWLDLDSDTSTGTDSGTETDLFAEIPSVEIEEEASGPDTDLFADIPSLDLGEDAADPVDEQTLLINEPPAQPVSTGGQDVGLDLLSDLLSDDLSDEDDSWLADLQMAAEEVDAVEKANLTGAGIDLNEEEDESGLARNELGELPDDPDAALALINQLATEQNQEEDELDAYEEPPMLDDLFDDEPPTTITTDELTKPPQPEEFPTIIVDVDDNLPNWLESSSGSDTALLDWLESEVNTNDLDWLSAEEAATKQVQETGKPVTGRLPTLDEMLGEGGAGNWPAFDATAQEPVDPKIFEDTQPIIQPLQSDFELPVADIDGGGPDTTISNTAMIEIEPLLIEADGAMQGGDVNAAIGKFREVLHSGKGTGVLIDALEAAVKKKKRNAALRRLLGDAYMKNGQLQNALEAYRKAQDLL